MGNELNNQREKRRRVAAAVVVVVVKKEEDLKRSFQKTHTYMIYIYTCTLPFSPLLRLKYR